MGYSDEMLRELEATIDAADVDIVVAGTPIDLAHVISSRHPIRRARYELQEVGRPTLSDALAPLVRLLHRPAGLAEQRS
jgi:predicted GTPase